jgi:peroxiredoxin
MKKLQILALTIGYVLAFSYYGCKKSEAPAAGDQAAEASAYFKLPDYKGGEVDLAAYAGKPVMLMFFTETCPYCRKAAPFIKKISDQYASKGLNAIGICVEDTAAPAAGFAKTFGLTFPIAYKGRNVAVQYKTQGVPYIFLLTKKHIVHNVWAGYDESFDKEIIKGVEEIIQ